MAYTATVRALAVHAGAIRQRLGDAYQRHGCTAADPGADIPNELALRLRDIHEELTAFDGPDGAIRSSVARLTEERATEIADEIVSLEYDLRTALEERRHD